MTGLNLETFLHLLRADVGVWASMGLAALVLTLLAWTSWGSRRALRKCFILSVAAHAGLILYGSTVPIALSSLQPGEGPAEPVVRVRLSPQVEGAVDPSRPDADPAGRSGRRAAPWDRPTDAPDLADAAVRPARPEASAVEIARITPTEIPATADESAAPDLDPPALVAPDAPALTDRTPAALPEPGAVAAVDPSDIAAPRPAATPATPEPTSPAIAEADVRGQLRPAGSARPAPPLESDFGPRQAIAASAAPANVADVAAPLVAERPRTRPPTFADRPEAAAPAVEADPSGPGVEPPRKLEATPEPVVLLPDADVRRRSRPDPAVDGGLIALATSRPGAEAASGPIALGRVTPAGMPGLPEIRGSVGGRPLGDVPLVYRSRLDPNRSALAQRAGASPGSEQAVERALDWLARHQDADGRWDGGTAKLDDGKVLGGEDNFTSHCPAGEICFGECQYYDADTALTGLALLSYLGAGYTHHDGKYADTVGKGLAYLMLVQKPDGDLRGRETAVGMYCHAMAALALSEAYALTGDERLRKPVERAVDFIVKGQAVDGMSWRYAPRAPAGDTSILGWVILVLKSAKVVGVPTPAAARVGSLDWLDKVADGKHKGLGKYRPREKVTPTMTAEAWVCRQFLDVGGPGPASDEAADYLLAHAPSKDQYNIYYWYYGTLAMYQHGGTPWREWNSQLRDQLVRRQRTSGHQIGSWDPDESTYGSYGGRIYSTALATLTLEVYYRYLRLYQSPESPPAMTGPARRRPADGPATDRR